VSEQVKRFLKNWLRFFVGIDGEKLTVRSWWLSMGGRCHLPRSGNTYVFVFCKYVHISMNAIRMYVHTRKIC
jgi:hypothetical protein